MRHWLLGLCALAACAGTHAQEAPLLHAMFQTHAVLQRDQPINVWGQAAPGETVKVELAGKRAQARADSQGNWDLRLPALKAGGPYVLSARTPTRQQRVDDVLVGDVWLCSGQSNMELQVWRTLDARAEIAGADNPRLRLMTVPQEGSATPLSSFPSPTRWQPVSSESVRDFSAACYYFARELQKKVDVPMGLINAAWGGSRIQAWTSAEALEILGGYNAELAVLDRYADDPIAAVGDWGMLWQRWWSTRAGMPVNDQPWTESGTRVGDWRKAPAQLGAWERWGVPALADFNGMLWYTASVTLTAEQAAQGASLQLGPADEIDMSWVNGRAVGSTYGAGGDRAYALPAGLLKAGRNTVVVNVLDTYRDGGLSGPASRHALHFADGSRAQLTDWRYRVVPAHVGSPPRAPWQTAAGLSTLYNGMIAPLGHTGLRGILWYQGESNTFEADHYADLLRALRADWRNRFGAHVPMLIVQLAGYGDPVTQPVNSEWAALREAQRQVAADANARSALAVTIDIGDRYDIHPSNKQELGRRLARAAQQVVYGENIAASGPVPRGIRRGDNTVVIEFADVERALVAYGGNGPIGFELCGDAADSCRYADATVAGNRVTLRAAAAHQATRVRYCWADFAICTLFDGAGLPAGPFEQSLPSLNPDDHAR